MFHKKIDKLQEYFFYFVIYGGYIALLLSLLGVNKFHHKYLDDLNYYFNVYISLFLLLRFNPFRQNVTFTRLDRDIAFSAGWFVFTNTIIKEYANQIQALFPATHRVNLNDIVL